MVHAGLSLLLEQWKVTTQLKEINSKVYQINSLSIVLMNTGAIGVAKVAGSTMDGITLNIMDSRA